MADISIIATANWDAIPLTAPTGGVLVIPPCQWEGARVGKCYNNVQEMIRRYGGEAVYGWALTDCGPHQAKGGRLPPLYRRWLNHVVWRDEQGQMWEVSPNAVIDNHAEIEFRATQFLPEPEATFELISDEEWYTQATRYFPLRPEGGARRPVAQHGSKRHERTGTQPSARASASRHNSPAFVRGNGRSKASASARAAFG